MKAKLLRLAAGLAACALTGASGQAPPPQFADANLTEKGVRDLAFACAACHGTGGRAVPGSSVPGLAGRPRAEIVQIMGQFKSGARPATVMHQIAKGYSDAEIAAIAEYFARQGR